MGGAILVLIEYLMFHFALKRSSRSMIDEIRTNFKFFPKHYALPPRWIRKHFNLKKNEIPKFLLFRLYLSLFLEILAPILSFVCAVAQSNQYVVGVIILIPYVLALPDMIIALILLHIFKK